MKSVGISLVFVLGILTVLAAGCMVPVSKATNTSAGTATVNYSTATAPVIPDLTGTWTGTMKSYDYGTGFNEHENSTIIFTITEQRGRLFTGRLTITVNSTTVVPDENVAGAISRDGTRFTLAEESGYVSGEILSDDEMEMIYTNDAAPFSVAIDSLKRS